MTFKMLCPECESEVETEWTTFEDPAEAEALDAKYGERDVDGPFSLDQVGQILENDGYEGIVGARIDMCSTCATVLRVWTYIR